MARGLALACLLTLGAVAMAAPPPRFPGTATTVAVNRADGRVAAVVGAKLLLLDSLASDTVARSFDLPGRDQSVREFRGNTIVYATSAVEDMPFVLVALSTDGRERLAWPNEGLSELFPTERSRLTLDGRGLYGELVLDGAVREYFELPKDIPVGSGVAATYRFAGEKMSARASEMFRQVVALTPDDMLIALKDGGVMRYRAGDGAIWKLDIAGPPWRLVDVDDKAGLLLGLEGGTVLRCLDTARGELRWQWDAGRQGDAIRAALGIAREPQPVAAPAKAAPRKGSKAAAAATSPAPPQVRVLDARLLRSGRVLILGDQPRRFLAVVDPGGDRLVGEELLSHLEAKGLDAVDAWWQEEATDLSGAWEMPGTAGVTLLLRGTDGWHEVVVAAPAQ
ncbi:MAG: hypothetical protein MUF10_20265 [Thermoanaerobaculaceae bacterium]|jgi:hypothetical protein|nr:hypothetical protein [Thermoanaerobaculaceae bacterium]